MLESDPQAPDWPHSPVPESAVWARRCRAQFLLIDPALDAGEASAMAMDMSTEARWRRMDPEAAVDWLYAS